MNMIWWLSSVLEEEEAVVRGWMLELLNSNFGNKQEESGKTPGEDRPVKSASKSKILVCLKRMGTC